MSEPSRQPECQAVCLLAVRADAAVFGIGDVPGARRLPDIDATVGPASDTAPQKSRPSFRLRAQLLV